VGTSQSVRAASEKRGKGRDSPGGGENPKGSLVHRRTRLMGGKAGKKR